MIELIFVIVILGILAAVAIPRLAATRDDAEISKAVTNINTLVSDITAFYTSKGKFTLATGSKATPNIADMTGVTLIGDDGKVVTSGATGNIAVKSKKCIELTVVDANSDGTPAYLKVKKVGTDAVCKMVADNPGVKSSLSSKFSYTKTSGTGSTAKTAEETLPASSESNTGYIKVGGTGVIY
ncbi:MAG: type II secretion system GspH family protein [Campylobacter sp.]|nr:type II secretion system GspH family protein [Campylobacter sp.]